MPLAFFGTFFRFERKYFPLRGGSPTVRAVVGASCIRSGFPSGKVGVHRHRQVAFRSPPAPLRFAYPSKTAPHKAAPVLPRRSRCVIPIGKSRSFPRGKHSANHCLQISSSGKTNSTACTAVPSAVMLKNQPDWRSKLPGKCKATALLPYSSFAMSSASVIMFVSVVWRSSAVMARLSSPMMSLTVRMPSAFLCR